MSILFSPYQIKDMTLRNRVVMPPMCQYVGGDDGLVTDWHIMHYGARAVGGVGLIIVEATAVEPRGRISSRDLGLWHDGQVEGMRRLVGFCRSQGTAVGVQLAHAGRKGGGKELIAPSSLRFSEDYPTPVEMSSEEMREVVDAFGEAARRANRAGFDVIEIHAAHGYLIHEFLSPLTNRRNDGYGGAPEKRRRFLLEVVEAVKAHWPAAKPLLVRLSAVDYHEGGINLQDTIQICQSLKQAGIDGIDVSSGGLIPAMPKVGPGYQVPFAEAVKRQVEIPTITVGLITHAVQAEEILFNRRADMVALGRELLRNPHWPLYAARDLGDSVEWPKPYERAKI